MSDEKIQALDKGDVLNRTGVSTDRLVNDEKRLASATPITHESKPISFYDTTEELQFDNLDIFNKNENLLQIPVPRRCCAIGFKPSTWLFNIGTAGEAKTRPLDINQLGPHRYGGPDSTGRGVTGSIIRLFAKGGTAFIGEGKQFIPVDKSYPPPSSNIRVIKPFLSKDVVGHLYTKRGGIIDLGHVRDFIDKTAFFTKAAFNLFSEKDVVITPRFSAVKQKRSPFTEIIVAEMPPELGERSVGLGPLPDQILTPRLCALIGASIAYDFSIWHELVTWIAKSGMSLKQPYSAFSPEDNFSNLLGCYVGFRACLTPDLLFNEAATSELYRLLLELGPVKVEQTEQAIRYVEDHWYKYKSGRMGDNLQLLRRHFEALPRVIPWLITDVKVPGKKEILDKLRKDLGTPSPTILEAPEHDGRGKSLKHHYYTFYIDLDKSKLRSPFGDLIDDSITSRNFPDLINKVRDDILRETPDGDKP